MTLAALLRPRLTKAKPKAKVTGVAVYVEKKQAKVARKVAAQLKEHGARVAEEVAKSYASKIQKNESIDGIIQSILDGLGLNGISIDIIDSVSPELVRAFKEAGILGVAQVGITATAEMTKHLDKAAMDYVEDHGAERVKNLTATTEEALRSTLSRAVKEGMSAQKLSAEIQATGAFGEARANTIARTELAMAHVNGNTQGWKETGLVTGKQSILGDLHEIDDVCDECAMAGVVGLDEDFVPGFKQPPYHPNCICDVLPVMGEA